MRPVTYFILMAFATFVALVKPIASEAQTIQVDMIKNQMISDWQRAKAYTNDYLQAMPADKYSFKAVDSIRSFAQQMLHLAQANIFFAATATGKKPLYEGFNMERSNTAQSRDSVMHYVNASYDFVITNLQGLGAAQFAETVKAFGSDYARGILFMKAFEHQTHHRGQATIYIRLLGIRPPGERLF